MTILIGYDGSEAALTALDWALVEARARCTPLTVCHVEQDNAIDPPPEGVISAVLDRIHERAPDVKTAMIALEGSAAEVLLGQSATAELVVVGHRGRGGILGLEIGSVSAHLAAHAGVPVVVVRGETEPPPEYQPGCVVVGFDGTESGRAALRFALREAWLHALPLIAICVWTHEKVTVHVPFVGGEDLRAFAQERFLAALSDAQASYPDVDVHPRFLVGDPAEALCVAATAARLLVVGVGAAFRTRGSVAHAALRSAPCPVAVIHSHVIESR